MTSENNQIFLTKVETFLKTQEGDSDILAGPIINFLTIHHNELTEDALTATIDEFAKNYPDEGKIGLLRKLVRAAFTPQTS